MISFVIPAYNEEALLGRTLDSIFQAARAVGRPFEVIVVNDASNDRTAEIARERGAKVVDVELRQIAAVRNAGARQAQGDVLIFVDADTLMPEVTLRAALAALERGAVGGGSRVALGGEIPLAGRLYFNLFFLIWRPLNLAAGCFVYARRDVFEKVGGFDERYFASEEVWLSKALKQHGRFVVVRDPVVTCGRKVRMYTARQLFMISLRLLVLGPKSWQRREGLELWYDGQREAVDNR